MKKSQDFKKGKVESEAKQIAYVYKHQTKGTKQSKQRYKHVLACRWNHYVCYLLGKNIEYYAYYDLNFVNICFYIHIKAPKPNYTHKNVNNGYLRATEL